MIMGDSKPLTGGSLSLQTGEGTYTTSGAIVLSSVNSGTKGVSGKLSFTSGTTSSGTSGKFVVNTGMATNGKGGDVEDYDWWRYGNERINW